MADKEKDTGQAGERKVIYVPEEDEHVMKAIDDLIEREMKAGYRPSFSSTAVRLLKIGLSREGFKNMGVTPGKGHG